MKTKIVKTGCGWAVVVPDESGAYALPSLSQRDLYYGTEAEALAAQIEREARQ